MRERWKRLPLHAGKANILQDEFRRWFAGLWHGRSLAGTVAFLTLVLTLVLRAVANAAAPRAENASGPGLRLVGGQGARRDGDGPPR